MRNRDVCSFHRIVWACAAFTTACTDHGEPVEVVATQQAIWTNGDFESTAIGAAPTGWTTTRFTNPGITVTTPQTYAGLRLTANAGQLQTFVVGGAAESQTDPDLGAAGSIRFPKYGLRGARINYLSNTTSPNKGASNNANLLQQSMTTTLGDVDPVDDKIHVRFALAPVLQDPGHPAVQQPYYYVDLRNITTGQTLYQDFNTSGQPGVPWQTATSVLDNSVVKYTSWQLVDIAPGNAVIRVGDQIDLRVVAAGCAAGGHWGRVYLDAVGSGIPGLYTWMTGAQSANAGDILTYTVNYKNGGTAAVTGTQLDMVMPPSTTFISLSTPGACTAPAVGANGTVTCLLGPLAQGATGTFTITVKINVGATGTVTNGSYSIQATGVNPLIGPKVVTAITGGVTYADVGITDSDGLAAVTWGQALTHTIVVSNAGPTGAFTVAVADTFPAQLTGVTWTCAAIGGATCTASGTGNISDNISVPSGATATYTVSATVVAGSGSGSMTNIATATVTGATDPNTSDNTAVDTDSIGSLQTLTLTKTGATGGRVNSSPASIDCGSDCSSASAVFQDSASVILTAAPVPGSTFLGWGGACAGTTPSCTVTMNGAQSVTASFTAVATLSLSSGSGQMATVSTAFGTPLKVLLSDSAGAPVSGATVYFVGPPSGAGATLSSATALTNASGIATISASANASAGTYDVTATSTGVAGSVLFSLSNLGTPSSVGVFAGGPQSATINTAYATALVAVVRDAAGVPLANIPVTFSAPGSLATAVLGGPTSGTSDSAGRFSVTATANSKSGTYNITAAVTGATSGLFALTNVAGPVASIQVSGGDLQTRTVGLAFTVALGAWVRDALGNSVIGASVSFSAPGSTATATLSAASALTNASGIASVIATANQRPGAYNVSASVAGVATPITFGLTNLVGAATSIAAVSGAGQSAAVGTAFAVAIVAEARDQYANPVPGKSVAFGVPAQTVASGVVSATPVVSDSVGRSSITVTANVRAGAYNVTASTAGATSATFGLTNLAFAPATIVASSGASQSAVVGAVFGTALQVTVQDSNGNPVSGASVTFAGFPGSGASATPSSSSVTTNASGQASVTVTANHTVGAYSPTATVAGVSPASFALSNTPGAAAAISGTGGVTQSAVVDALFGASLEVLVTDSYGNAKPGVTVTFAAPGGAATASLSALTVATDGTGHASVNATANGGAGTYNVSASAVGTGAAVNFALTNTAGAAASVSVSSGSAQSVTIESAFAPLVARVADSHNNPVAGVSVTFAAPAATGASAVLGSAGASNALGLVSIAATANDHAGAYLVTASVAGIGTPASFSVTNGAGAAATLSASGGSGQTTVVNTAFATALTVTVADNRGNPVSGVALTFSAPGGAGASAALSGTAATSDAAGQGSVTVTANTVAGAYAISVSGVGVATPASFTLTNAPGAAASLAANSGAGQSATVASGFAAALVARVTDTYGNPVPGVRVDFAAPSSTSSAALSAAFAVTSASGLGSVTATANNFAGTYSVTASLGTGQSALFALTNSPGAVGSIVASAGGGQTATVAALFGTPLEATVLDAFLNPVPGVLVTFAAPASAATATLSSATALSDGLGHAGVSATGNHGSGSYTISATAPNAAAPATFALTNAPGAANSIVSSAGANQSTTVAQALATPLLATVLDVYGNPVPGASVSFMVPASGASLVLASATGTTDGLGQISVTGNANGVAGTYNVSAAVSGVATPTLFGLTNVFGAVGSIAAVGGTGQTTTVMTQFATALTVAVVDAYDNPVSGSVVTFSAPLSGASGTLSSGTATTDVAGNASVTLLANGVAGTYSVSASVPGAASSVSFPLTNAPGAAAALSAFAGATQSATVNTQFATALAVAVVDAYGNAVPGALVTLVAPASGASSTLSSTSLTTDTAGHASASATANAIAGGFVVTAALSAGPSVGFALTNLSGAPGAISVSGGSGQSAVVGTAFLLPLSVTVRDVDGNPVAAASVSFSAPLLNASAVLSAPSALTDVNGVASVNAIANDVAGGFAVVATVAGAAGPASVLLTNSPGAVAAISGTGGSGQSATVETSFLAALLVTVVDAHDNPVPGVSVSFAAPSSGASTTLSAASVSTDAQGHASVTAIANGVAGSYSVTASVAGAATAALFALTNSSGPVGSIAVTTGTGQTATVDAAFAAALTVTVRDALGNAVPGATVSFAAAMSGASALLSATSVTTDAAGQASVNATANTLAGSYGVVASVPGAALPASFTLTNVAGAAASISATQGDPQSSLVTTAFGVTLIATVRDAHANPVAGVVVAFSAPVTGASASLSTASATSGANGQVSVSVQANGTAGSYEVQGGAPGITTPAVFRLTNSPGPAATLVILAGDGQSAVVNAAFASALTVRVIDAQGNPAPAVIVTFAAQSGGAATASLDASTHTTDANGEASVLLAANAVAGGYLVLASAAGVAIDASFSVSNTAGAASSINVTAGAGQSTLVTAAFGTLLGFQVLDADLNPVPGVTVEFSAPLTSASATFGQAAAVTDASGSVTVLATANSVAGGYQVTATLAGQVVATSLALTNSAGAAASIAADGGSIQSAVVSTAFAQRLAVKVFDAYQNPLSGVQVDFAVPSAGPSAALASLSATTDSAGRASVAASASALAGEYVVLASVTGASTPVTFTLVNLPGAASALLASAGAGQSTGVTTAFATPLTLTLVDSFGNPVPGAALSLAAPASGASAALSRSAATTDALGQASVTVIANSVAGTYDVSAAALGVVSPATFALTNLAGAAASLTANGGGGQGATVSTTFAAALIASVTDAYGNPVSGVSVDFTPPGSGASAVLSATSAVTDFAGDVSVTALANSVAGGYSVTASLGGLTALFTLSNSAGAVGSIVASGGAAQTASVTTAFASPLEATVLDAFANPVQGVLVTFAAPASAATATLSGLSAVSNAAGRASISAIASPVSGAYLVSASAPDVLAPATFALTNSAGAASTLVASRGSLQSAQVTHGFTNALLVTLLDAHGNPVSGASVSFAVPGSGASAVLTSPNVITDGAGRASSAATANAIAGAYTVSAAVSGVSGPALFSLANLSGPPGSIAAIGGAGQSATVATTFAVRLSVLVVDAFDNPVSGAPVTFSAPTAGASATLTNTVSDADGHASSLVLANGVAGRYEVTASAAGAATPVIFPLTNTPGAADSLRVTAGDRQSATVNTLFATPLAIAVVDAYGNATPGARITLSAPASGASSALSSLELLTDAAGHASASATANDTAGSFEVIATLESMAAGSFTLTNLAGAPGSISVSSGSGQTTTVASAFALPLTVRVIDADGNPVPAVSVSFSAPAAGASAVLMPASELTDADGLVSITVIANELAGTYTVEASVPGAASPAIVTLTNTASGPAAISVSAGGVQSAIVQTAFAAALSVTVLDSHGNPVPDESVAFQAPGSGASALLDALSVATDLQGRASVSATANELAGSYDVTASVLGVALPASFMLSNVAGASASIAATQGNAQSSAVTTAFGAALIATVRDAYDNPVAGAVVTFTVPSQGASATPSVAAATSGTNGEVSITVTANAVAGSYQLIASLDGSSLTAAFSLTNLSGTASSIALVSGDMQSAIVDGTFAAPLRARVLDAQGNPVSGVSVAFLAPASGPSAVLGASAVSDPLGLVSASATANASAGTYAVTASFAGAGAPVTFNLTNQPGAVSVLSASGGAGQSANVTTAFATALTVTAVDVRGNPVPGVALSFSAPSAGASAALSSTSATTDGAGHASVSVIANRVAGSYAVGAMAVGAASPVTFALTNLAGAAASLAASGGAGQSATVSTAFAAALIASVTDAYGNPVSGARIDFAAPIAGPSAALNVAFVVTDAAGEARVTATAGSVAGTYNVSATLGEPGLGALFALNNSAGPVGSIIASGGAAQTATVATAFAMLLEATVLDAFANPVAGVLVTFAAPPSAATATLSSASAISDASGRATVSAFGSSVSGTYVVSATAPDVLAPVTFALTNRAGPANSIVSSSAASNQSATVAHAFVNALLVTLRDAYGNPVPGASVAFAVPDSGASAVLTSPSAITNGLGQASVVATANGVAGTYTSTAAVSGLGARGAFTLTNVAGPVGSIAAIGGAGQTTVVATAFASALTVRVADVYDNPVSGSVVAFSVPTSGASGTLSRSSALTDSEGQASVMVFANTLAGSYDVSASAPGTAAPALFPLANAHGAAASLHTNGGAGQSTRVNTLFAAPLSVAVFDAYDNPVAGALVTLLAPASGASAALSRLSLLTDAAGHASASATANPVVGSFEVTATLPGGAAASFALSNLSGAPGSISVSAGSGQSTTVGSAFALPLSVRVLDADGNPVPAVSVGFSAPLRDASAVLSDASALTDADGLVSIQALANELAGTFVVIASVAGAASPALLTLTNTPGTAAAISVSGGDLQSAQVQTAFASALSVTVTDAHDNPVAGASVAFDAPGSAATAALSAATAQTDGQGHASITAFANTVAGSYNVTASVAGLATPAQFALTNSVGPVGTIVITGGSNQSSVVDSVFATQLGVMVLDALGNAVTGAPVTFTAVANGPSATLSMTVITTDALGLARITATANELAGSYGIIASVPGAAGPVSFALTNLPAGVATITASSGGAQASVVTNAFGAPLVATVRDLHGNPVRAVAVTFAAPASGASAALSRSAAVSDAAGEVSITAIANALAGAYEIRATAAGATSPAIFALTNLPGTAASIVVLAGDGQSAVVDSAFATPLTVRVLDAQGNPAPGASVSFAAVSGGTATANIAAPTQISNATGQASVLLTANAVAGGYQVIASVAGVSSVVSFSLSNRSGAAASITVTAGSGQTAPVTAPFATPLTVQVLDALNNPIGGVTVSFSTPPSGAAATFASSSRVTDDTGHVSVTASANSIAGAYQVTAVVVGEALNVTLELSNSVGAASLIVADSGSGQSTLVSSAFAMPLALTVFDAYHNPAPGVQVSFSLPGSEPTAVLGDSETVTDAAGRVSVTLRASTGAGAYVVSASVLGVAAPALFALENLPGAAAVIDIDSGSPQSATILGDFSIPLVVTLRDAFENPVPHAALHFNAPSTGPSASIQGPAVVTDGAGRASTTATANASAGAYLVVASLDGSPLTASFMLLNLAGAPATIALVSGDAQSALVHQRFSEALILRVFDSSGNPVSGSTVAFAAPGGGASSSLSAARVITDSTGLASVSADANSVAGAYSVTASVAGIDATFALTNLPGAPARVVIAPGEATRAATVHEAFGALRVTVVDADGNVVSGVPIVFSAPSSGALATLSAIDVTSDADGGATVNATAGAIRGTYSVVARAGGLAATFTLTNLAGAPDTILAESGGDASATVQTAFAAELEAMVLDSDGNPVPDTLVTFAAPSSGPTATLGAAALRTDSNGRVHVPITAGTIAGSYLVTASLQSALEGATFALTNDPGPAARLLAALDSTPQSAQVDAVYTRPCSATLTDALGNPIAGAVVQFTAPGSGASATLDPQAATTDTQGAVQVNAVANAIAGPFVVRATLAGSTLQASFDLTNLSGPATSLVMGSGSPQEATVGERYAAALQVFVRDVHDNPVSNSDVTFSVPASGATASLSLSSATTDANGQVAVEATAGTQAGELVVSAVSAVAATPLLFRLRNLAGQLTSIVPVAAATPQSAPVGTAFVAPLRVAASDAYGNPVAGATIDFSAPAVDATAILSANVALTDSAGFAEINAIASLFAGDYLVEAISGGATQPALFALSNLEFGASLLTLVDGSNQHAPAGSAFASALAFEVHDSFGHLQPGVTIDLSVPASNRPSVILPEQRIVTDADGRAEIIVQANDHPGAVKVIASIDAGATPIIANLTIDTIATSIALATVDDAPTAAAPVLVSVTVQSDSREPQGRVRFIADDQEVGQVSVAAGVASLEVLLKPGVHRVSASFDAELPFASSQSSSITITVAEDGGTLTGSGTCSVSHVGAVESHAPLLLLVVLLLALGWRERIRRALFALALAACIAWSAPTNAQTGGLALDRFHAAPAGSDWFALDSLGIDRHLRWSTRLIADYAIHPLIIHNVDGSQRSIPVRRQLMLRANGSLTLYRHWRVSFSVPFAPYQTGDAGVYSGYRFASPSPAFGDVALRGDYLVTGSHDERLVVAIGAEAHAPSGSRVNYTSDGTFGIEPHLLFAGSLDPFIYAAQCGILLRGEAEFAGQRYGHEWQFGLGGGVTMLHGKLVVGPELLIATPLGAGQSAAEVELGMHYAWNEHWHTGIGFGLGIGASRGTPRERGLLYVEYSAGGESSSHLPVTP